MWAWKATTMDTRNQTTSTETMTRLFLDPKETQVLRVLLAPGVYLVLLGGEELGVLLVHMETLVCLVLLVPRAPRAIQDCPQVRPRQETRATEVHKVF